MKFKEFFMKNIKILIKMYMKIKLKQKKLKEI